MAACRSLVSAGGVEWNGASARGAGGTRAEPDQGAASLPEAVKSSGEKRICVIGAGPCGLTALKNLLQAGCGNVVCYEESSGIGGNWAFTDDPHRISVYECSHIISSRRRSSFDGFPMPNDYPEFPSHRQLLAYFTDYARAFQLEPHIRLGLQAPRPVPRPARAHGRRGQLRR